MIRFVSLATLLFSASLVVSDELSSLKLLSFSPNSYIEFTPDWSSLVSQISVCSWIRDLGSSPHRTFFSYGTSGYIDMTILADGSYISIFGSYMHHQSRFNVPKGTWHHVCVTWSYSSRTHRYYVNGVLLGSQTTPSGRTFYPGGAAVVGKWVTTSSSHDFAGQMAYLNVYNKELSSSEVASMARAGLCSIAVDQHETYRVFKWEDILKKTRTGSIVDYYIGECVEELVEVMGGRVEEAERRQNSTAAELSLALAEKEDLSTRLNRTQIDKEDLSTRLNSTQIELEELLANLNRTWDWDVFLTDQFLNETFTSEHSLLLRSSWDGIADKLVGIRITEEFLTLSAHIDKKEDRPWTMLYSDNYFNEVFTKEKAARLTSIWDGISEKLVGITLTKEIIELLNHVTDKTNCGK
ncbi:hypothetical protein ACHWQZ_G013071 [Mnemiopsis leidyi]